MIWRAFLETAENASGPKNYFKCTRCITNNLMSNILYYFKKARYEIEKYIGTVCLKSYLQLLENRREKILLGPEMFSRVLRYARLVRDLNHDPRLSNLVFAATPTARI